MSNQRWLPRCAICKRTVNLNLSKADEYGRAVHEECYVSLLLRKEPGLLSRTEMKMFMSAG